MVLQRIRRAAAVLALAATLALAAPAHAAGWDLAAGPGWFESVIERIARLWVGDGETSGPTPTSEKCGSSANPDGCPGGAPSPPRPSSSSGSGSGG
jgi:hypothetical protein